MQQVVGGIRNAVVLLAFLICTLLAVLRTPMPRASRLTAWFPPWWTGGRAFAAAAGAGLIVALGPLPSVLIVQGDPAGLADRLRAAGAIFIVDASGPAGCHPANKDTP